MTDPLFGTYFSRKYIQGELLEIDDQLTLQAHVRFGGWIQWKNHRLAQIHFYNSKDPPKRIHETEDAPPRIILREDSHQNTNVPATPGFPSPGDLEFKIWLQNKIEEVSRGRVSPRFLSGQDRKEEREKAMEKWDELAIDPNRGIRLFLDKELYDNQKIAEIRHLHLMQKILGRVEPFVGAEVIDPNFPFPQGTKRNYGLIDRICRELVRSMISKSRTTEPSYEDVYYRQKDVEIFDYAKTKGIEIEPSRVTLHIQENTIFHRGHRGGSTFNKEKWVKEINKRGMNQTEYRGKIKLGLTIHELVEQKIPPRDEWMYSIIWLPAMTFGKALAEKLSKIILDAWEEVKVIANVGNTPGIGDKAKLFDPQLGLTPKELEDLKSLTLPKFWDSKQQGFVNAPLTKEHPKRKQGGFGTRQGIDVTDSPEDASKHNAKKHAGNIIAALQENRIIDNRPMTDQEYRLYWYDGDENKKRPKWSNPNLIYFTERLKQGDRCSCPNSSSCDCFSGITKSDPGDFRKRKEHAIYRWLRGDTDRWMYSPPENHRIDKVGGLLIPEIRRITTASNIIYENEFDTPRCKLNQEIISAMNALQDTQWEINLHLLATLFDIKLEDGTNLSEHPVSNWNDKKKTLIQRTFPKPKKSFRKAFYHESNDETNQERDLMIEYARRIIDHNANVFWHSWVCDSRGRLYPRCTLLSPQGNDTSKAMIRFKHWKPLGEKGRKWLHVHVQNLMQGIENDSWIGGPAGKKETFDDKDAWVTDNLPELRRIANDPSGYAKLLELDIRRKPKSEVFQRLAALLELDRAHTVWKEKREDWSRVTSGLPIHLDASCNGYQHVSTLLKHRKLAELVNVVGEKGEPPKDFYQEVADVAMLRSGEPHVCDSKCPKDKIWFSKNSKSKPKCGKGNVRRFVEEVWFDELTKGQYRRSDSWRIGFVLRHRGNPAVDDAEPKYATRFRMPNYRAILGKDYDLWREQVEATIKQIFSRSVVKQPIIVRGYGGTDFLKCLAGKGEEGAKLWRSVSKTEEEEKEDIETLSDIPKSFRQCLERLNLTLDPDERDELKEKLKKLSEKQTFQKGQPNDWINALKEKKSFFIWNEGSGLQKALIDQNTIDAFDVNPKKHGISSQERDIRSRRQNELAYLVQAAIKKAINEVTEGAFSAVEKPLKEYANGKSGMYPGIQWSLPQDAKNGFEVNHYRIKEFQSDETKKDNPFHPLSVYSARLPDWYSSNRNHKTILKRLTELYNDSIFGSGTGLKKEFGQLRKAKGKKVFKPLAEDFLEKHHPDRNNEDIEDIRRILSHFEISVSRYYQDESKRIEHNKEEVKKKADEMTEEKGRKPTDDEMAVLRANNHKLASSLPPNFIHSLDSFHMRKTINKLKQSIPQLSFWSVHDAFGTHACDVAEMRDVVRQMFHDLHDEIDFDYMINPEKRDPELDLSDILDADYIIS